MNAAVSPAEASAGGPRQHGSATLSSSSFSSLPFSVSGFRFTAAFPFLPL